MQLTAEGATEEAFRRTAPHHRFLHLATHGFFAGEDLLSALRPYEPTMEGTLLARHGVAGFHPGLLSGLALAGASSSSTPKWEDDDGVLTALEVGSLDLRQVEMVVLSACETGLGASAGGEGILGLQRAFQIAGARTTVASLWQVDDLATRLLMERFYRNLWIEGMGKLEALREAQRWMLREGGEALREPAVGSRGGRRPWESDTPALSPRLWAGMVLSGDWR